MVHHTIYCNGQLSKTPAPLIHPHDRGFLLADGIFETLRIYQGNPVQFDRHWQRLTGSAQFLEIVIPASKNQLRQAIHQLLNANDLACADAGLRITLSRGSGERGLWPAETGKSTLLINTFALTAVPAVGSKLITATIKRNHLSPLANIKSLNYLDNILARREAVAAGADDAVLLNVAGNVAEVSTANIFIIKNNTVITPKLSDGALPGVARATILQLCQQMAINRVEDVITTHDLTVADAAFISNALLPIHPVQSCDNTHFKTNHVLTVQLKTAYQQYINELV